ncbi:kelch-like protein 21 isoform X2 [Pogona vitticeps]
MSGQLCSWSAFKGPILCRSSAGSPEGFCSTAGKTGGLCTLTTLSVRRGRVPGGTFVSLFRVGGRNLVKANPFDLVGASGLLSADGAAGRPWAKGARSQQQKRRFGGATSLSVAECCFCCLPWEAAGNRNGAVQLPSGAPLADPPAAPRLVRDSRRRGKGGRSVRAASSSSSSSLARGRRAEEAEPPKGRRRALGRTSGRQSPVGGAAMEVGGEAAHASAVLRGLAALRAERALLDVTLVAGGGEFGAHRAVLAAASGYFRAMFGGGLREARAARVRLHGVEPECLALLLDFAYTGRLAALETGASEGLAERLLRAADLLQFPAVKAACGAWLAARLEPSAALELEDFGEAFACAPLAEAARRCVLRHAAEPEGELGAQLERVPLGRLVSYLREDALRVPKEEAAFALALRWVRAEPAARAPLLPQLLAHVRLPFVRRFALLAQVEGEPLVARSEPCRRLVAEARLFQDGRLDRHDRGPCARLRPRPSTGLAEILVVLGGCDRDCDELVTVDCFNPRTGHWRYLAEFPEHLGGGYSAAALGNDIYVTGGSDGSRLYDCVWRYNSSVNEWTEVSPMLKAREYHSSVVLDGLLYVVAADSTERYDHTLDSWEPLQPMMYPMDNCSTTACRGKLYAVGSLAGKESMVMQCYDPELDLWSLVNCGQLPPWSFAPKTVTLSGLMYFVRDDSAEVDVYNPAKNEWDKIPSMLQVHVGGSLSALGGKLYVSGGYDNTFELSSMVECYDPETRKWSVAGKLPEPIFWHSSVSIFRQFMPETLQEEEERPLDNAFSLNQQLQNLHNQNLNELR